MLVLKIVYDDSTYTEIYGVKESQSVWDRGTLVWFFFMNQGEAGKPPYATVNLKRAWATLIAGKPVSDSDAEAITGLEGMAAMDRLRELVYATDGGCMEGYHARVEL